MPEIDEVHRIKTIPTDWELAVRTRPTAVLRASLRSALWTALPALGLLLRGGPFLIFTGLAVGALALLLLASMLVVPREPVVAASHLGICIRNGLSPLASSYFVGWHRVTQLTVGRSIWAGRLLSVRYRTDANGERTIHLPVAALGPHAEATISRIAALSKDWTSMTVAT